jgi:hypothetical protein
MSTDGHVITMGFNDWCLIFVWLGWNMEVEISLPLVAL